MNNPNQLHCVHTYTTCEWCSSLHWLTQRWCNLCTVFNPFIHVRQSISTNRRQLIAKVVYHSFFQKVRIFLQQLFSTTKSQFCRSLDVPVFISQVMRLNIIFLIERTVFGLCTTTSLYMCRHPCQHTARDGGKLIFFIFNFVVPSPILCPFDSGCRRLSAFNVSISHILVRENRTKGCDRCYESGNVGFHQFPISFPLQVIPANVECPAEADECNQNHDDKTAKKRCVLIWAFRNMIIRMLITSITLENNSTPND